MSLLRIKELMKDKGISREKLAEEVGVTKASISSMASGKNTPSIKVLLKMAEVFDVDIRDLFNPTKPMAITASEILEAKELIQKGLKILDGFSK